MQIKKYCMQCKTKRRWLNKDGILCYIHLFFVQDNGGGRKEHRMSHFLH